jgi:hypothetical protein
MEAWVLPVIGCPVSSMRWWRDFDGRDDMKCAPIASKPSGLKA